MTSQDNFGLDISSNITHAKSVSVDPSEMANFAKMAEDWWNPNGKFKPLHIMNGFRTRLIKDEVITHLGLAPSPAAAQPLKGVRILDIGCGGGLLSEPMTRLGAQVTGVDALEKNVKTAHAHAVEMGLDIDYRFSTIEALVEAGHPKFDVVMAMEILEHVTDPAAFTKQCAAMLRPGGVMVCSTINRTLKAFTLAILGAEYVMRWLPKGTHQYDKFIKPSELSRLLSGGKLSPNDAIGMVFNPIKQSWKSSSDTNVNYMISAINPTTP